jgi:hypothetical protein
VGFGTSAIDLGRLREGAGEHKALLIGGAVGLAVLAVIAIGPARDFIEKIDDVQGSSGRLSSPVFPGEALGIWPEGDFRLVRGEVDGAFLATGFAALCALGAVLALIRRREWAPLSVLAAAVFVYALARPFAQIHVEAKALCVLAPIMMLVTVRWLLSPGRESGGLARQAVGAVFCTLALASTFLALRSAPVGFDERGSEDLRALAERVDGSSVVFLGVDRFAGYWLRGTLAESPGGYVPQDVEARPEKTWQQGLAMDFDTLSPSKLDHYDFAITTAAAYASTPPPSFTEVAQEGDYVLWERTGPTPPTRVLDKEGGNPGAFLEDCLGADDGTATVLGPYRSADQNKWRPTFNWTAPGDASVTVGPVPAGDYDISLQYHSQSPITVSAAGEDVAELPPTLEGFYLTGAGRGAFWPAGKITVSGGPPEVGVPVEIEVSADEPSGLQRALGVERSTWLGTVALTSRDRPETTELVRACNEYVDHYEAVR